MLPLRSAAMITPSKKVWSSMNNGFHDNDDVAHPITNIRSAPIPAKYSGPQPHNPRYPNTTATQGRDIKTSARPKPSVKQKKKAIPTLNIKPGRSWGASWRMKRNTNQTTKTSDATIVLIKYALIGLTAFKLRAPIWPCDNQINPRKTVPR